MKIGVSSYSYQGYINAGKMTQADCVEKAGEMGFDAVEFIDLKPHDGSTPEGYAEKIRKRAETAGIEISAYTVGACLIKNTAEETAAELERVKRQIDIAEILGVTKMRHDAYFVQTKYRSFDLALPELAENCRILTEYAKSKGVRTMVENHGFVCQDSERLERLYNAVDHENFGLLVDMGNFLCVDEAPEHAISRLAPYAIHVHLKDFKIYPHSLGEGGGILTRGCNTIKGTSVGDGDVPIKQCIDILKRAGYNDVFSIEFEGAGDCVEGIARGLAFARSL